MRTDCELGPQVPKGEVCGCRQKLVSVFPLCLDRSALRKEPVWAVQAGERGGHRPPGVSGAPGVPSCLWPCLRGLLGVLWVRGCVCCTWLLGLWLCGVRARSGRSRWALHPSRGESWELQWSPVPCWQLPFCREASFCLALLPLVSLKRWDGQLVTWLGVPSL